jgi:CheY-like chemotaxis protein
MDSLRILLIEDNNDDYELVLDAVNTFNDDVHQIKLERAVNKDEANELIESSFFDAIIIDLKLSNNNEDGLEGFQIFDLIRNNHIAITIIYSGTVIDADDFEGAINGFSKVYTKGGDVLISNILEEIRNIYKTGVTRLFSKEGELIKNVEKELLKIYWNHLSTSIEYWIQNNDKNSLHRYAISHIKEYWNYEEDAFGEYHPAEVYITPPISSFYYTGDILLIDNKQYVIMNPACDMVIQQGNNKPKAIHIVLCPLHKWKEFVDAPLDVDSYAALSDGKQRKLKTSKARYYNSILPSYPPIIGGRIDFQNITMKPYQSLIEEDIKRIGTIVSPFMKDIINQFSNYYSRQGTPNINQEQLYNSL